MYHKRRLVINRRRKETIDDLRLRRIKRKRYWKEYRKRKRREKVTALKSRLTEIINTVRGIENDTTGRN